MFIAIAQTNNVFLQNKPIQKDYQVQPMCHMLKVNLYTISVYDEMISHMLMRCKTKA